MDVAERTLTYPLEADLACLMEFARANQDRYLSASPFPHIAIDDFIRPELLEAVARDFPSHDQARWNAMIDRDQKKFAVNSTETLSPSVRQLLYFLNSRDIINFLERLTGISGLIPDAHLAGGGLHELRLGGFLKVHADFNWHKQLRLDRRINLIIYLNKEWDSEYGGNLELWDKSMAGKVKEYPPIFNKCVIFNTTDTSFHGNPVPVNCPPNRSRRSIAMYYYTNGRPESEVSASHGTLFKSRPGEATAADRRTTFAKSFVPPIMWSLWRSLKNRQNTSLQK